jgi:hypothetical protein
MSATQSVTYEGSNGSSGTAAAEAVGGIAAIVLTILGLAHVAPGFLVAIATIAIGAALLAQGSAIAAEYARLMTSRGETTVIPLGGSSTWSIELLAGIAGIVLGILALLAVESINLVAIASIAFGGGLVLSSGAAAQVLILKATGTSLDERVRRLAAETASTSAVAQGMTGLAAVVLGILALAGFSSVTLVLIALLAMGVFLVMNGSTVGGFMLSIFRR